MNLERPTLSRAPGVLLALAPAMLIPAVLVAAPRRWWSVGLWWPEGLSAIEIALIIAFLVISLGLHEAAHGWMALKCGDPTARDLGRISLNPLVHIDPFMTVILPAMLYLFTGFMFGGAKPVPVAYHRLRNPLRDMMFVALAGPISNVLLAILFMVTWKALYFSGSYGLDNSMLRVLGPTMFLNVVLAVFNLIPVPPLDGSRVMRWLLPRSLREPYDVLERFGILAIVVLMFLVPGFHSFLWGGITAAINMVDIITGGRW